MTSLSAGSVSGSYKSYGFVWGVSEQDGHDFLQYWVWVLQVLWSARGVSEQDRRDFFQCWVWVWVLQVWVCMGCFRARQA